MKKNVLGIDGTEEVLVAVGQMRRAAEALKVLVAGIAMEKVDRAVEPEKDPPAELLPVGAFVDERLQVSVVPVPGAVCEIGIDAIVAGDELQKPLFPVPLGEEKQGELFPEMGKIDLQVLLSEDLVPALRGDVLLQLWFPEGLESVVAAKEEICAYRGTTYNSTAT